VFFSTEQFAGTSSNTSSISDLYDALNEGNKQILIL
jgi:hypothetical protein